MSENYDRFGFAFAAGDFDGEGNDDPAIGVPEENLETVPANDAGIVQVLNGT